MKRWAKVLVTIAFILFILTALGAILDLSVVMGHLFSFMYLGALFSFTGAIIYEEEL